MKILFESFCRDVYEQSRKLEIVEDCGMIYLIEKNALGESIGDTWHQTVDLAMQQAVCQFGVSTSNWLDKRAAPDALNQSDLLDS